MRRVNEPVRAVVADGVGDLKDPRIGLVTVTGVNVYARPPRGDRVRLGARQRDAAAGDARGLASAHGFLQAKVARELEAAEDSARCRSTTIRRRARHPHDQAHRRRYADLTETEETETARQTDLDGRCRAHRERSLPRSRHENPDGDALGSMLAHVPRAARAREGRVMYLAGRRDAGRVRLHGARRGAPRAARATSASACSLAVDCANARRIGQDPAILEHAKTVRRRRPPSRQHALRDDEPDRRRRVVHRRDRPRPPLRELGVQLTPDIAEALYVGARHRHRPLPVLEHDAEVVPARGRARRGRRRRPRDLPQRLRDGRSSRS